MRNFRAHAILREFLRVVEEQTFFRSDLTTLDARGLVIELDLDRPKRPLLLRVIDKSGQSDVTRDSHLALACTDPVQVADSPPERDASLRAGTHRNKLSTGKPGMDKVVAKRMQASLKRTGIGGWTVSRLLGAGKSALVLEGARGKKRAAVKVFDPDLIERFGEQTQLDRIGRELSLTKERHPHLVRIRDGGKCAKTSFLFVAMDLIDAPNLASVIDRVPRDQVWPIIGQVASAAQFLETKGIAHRDIKPENIAISADFKTATLLDLGVIRPITTSEGTVSPTGQAFVGTLRYSSPEFLFRKEENTVDGWRAVTFYQLGAVLHDLLMRRPIFHDVSEPFAALVQAVQSLTPEIATNDLSQDLALLARNCLIKDPKTRLRMVKWDDFTPREESPLDVDQLRQRILRRSAATLASPPQALKQSRLAKQQTRVRLKEIEAAIEGLVRAECVDGDVFPPVVFHHDYALIDDGAATITVSFGPAESRNLLQVVSIALTIRLMDDVQSVIEVRVATALTRSEPFATAPPVEKSRQIFQGVFDSGALASRLRLALYESFDEAQGKASADMGEDPVWIT